MRRARGFSMVEMMITLVVIGVLASVAAPWMVKWVKDNRIRSQSSDLLSLLAIGRSEAAKLGVRVTICTSTTYASTPPSCTGGGAGAWRLGYIVFADVNGDGTFDSATDTLIRVSEPLAGGNTLTSSGFTTADKIQYRPSGTTNLPAAGGSFTLCDSRSGNFGRLITITVTGRASSAVTSCP